MSTQSTNLTLAGGAGDCPAFVLLIHHASMSHTEDQDDDPTVLNLSQNSIVPNSIAPLTAAVCGQTFAVLTRILAAL